MSYCLLPALERGPAQALPAQLHPPLAPVTQALLPCGQRERLKWSWVLTLASPLGPGCSLWPHPEALGDCGLCLASPLPSTQVGVEEATLAVWVEGFGDRCPSADQAKPTQLRELFAFLKLS